MAAMPGPADISRVRDGLYVASLPRRQDAPLIQSLGVHLILSLTLQPPPSRYHHAPFRVLRLPWPDSPLLPMPLRLLARGVTAALSEMDAQRGVLVHCRMGVHRSVALAACILIAQGATPRDAMGLVKEARPLADPYAWYVAPRIDLFALYWASHKPLARPERRSM